MNQKQADYFNIAMRILAATLIVFFIAYTIKYGEQLTTNPCKYCEEHTGRNCVLNTSKYVCACGKYYDTEQPQFDFSKVKINPGD